MGKEIIGWNREVQNGKGQGVQSKNEDANVLGCKILAGRENEESWRNPGEVLARTRRMGNELQKPGKILARIGRRRTGKGKK